MVRSLKERDRVHALLLPDQRAPGLTCSPSARTIERKPFFEWLLCPAFNRGSRGFTWCPVSPLSLADR